MSRNDNIHYVYLITSTREITIVMNVMYILKYDSKNNNSTLL